MRKTVAIVGRPNVGKSALFNRLAGKNISIVHDRPGVTRDRIVAECRRGPEVFEIMDTGGIGATTSDVLMDQVQTEAALALEVADLILFVVDSIEGLTPVDTTLAQMLRRIAKPVMLVCNKADNIRLERNAAEFSKMGFKDVFNCSAAHGLGVMDLVDVISERLGLGATPVPVSEEPEEEEVDEFAEPKPRPPRDWSKEPLKLAIVGKPNAGKSSLINAMLGTDRAIVSPVAGTTRDALDVDWTYEERTYRLIDTAGIRKKSGIHDPVEAFSVQKALKSIERADICLLVIDAAQGATAQDQRIAQIVAEKHKPCIIIANKFDLYHPDIKRKDRLENLRGDMNDILFFMTYAPVVATTATTKLGLAEVMKAVTRVAEGARQRVSTGNLNRLLHEAVENSAGPLGAANSGFKLLYATQVNNLDEKAVPVPHFVLFANRVSMLQDSYLRFLEGRIRSIFPAEGLPMFIKLKGKAKKGFK